MIIKAANRSPCGNQAGSASVEMIFIAMVFLALMFVGMDFARMMHDGTVVAAALRAGATYGAVAPDNAFATGTDSVRSRIIDFAESDSALSGFGSITGSSVTVSRRCFCPDDDSENDPCSQAQFDTMRTDCALRPELYLTATAVWPFAPVWQGLSSALSLPSVFNVTDTVVMRVQ